MCRFPIIVDDRIGSKEIVPYLPENLVRLQRLKFADVQFQGNGPEGIVTIGVEIKRLSDLMSSMKSGRLAGHQAPGMQASCDYCYLIVEGIWRTARDGVLERLTKYRKWSPYKKGRNPMLTTSLYGFCESMRRMFGFEIRFADHTRETATIIHGLHRWWGKEWSQHCSHLQKRQVVVEGHRMFKPNLVARIAAELPGIGAKKSREVGEHFETVEDMLKATPAEWQEIPGIGEGTALEAFHAIRGT